MNQIIPAILAKDVQEFRERLAMFEHETDTIQLDVLDNTLYPNSSWCEMDTIDTLDTTVWIELHLMVNDPEKYIEKIQSGGPVHRVIWHIEAPVDHEAVLTTCEHLGIEAGIAIAPSTSIEALRPFADRLDEILVLGVNPGFSGGILIPHAIQQARDIHHHWPAVLKGFDGGVTLQNIPQLREAGITRFYTASALWKSENPLESLHILQGV